MKLTLPVACILLKSAWQAVRRSFSDPFLRLSTLRSALAALLLAPLSMTQGAPSDGAIFLGTELAQMIKPGAAAVTRSDEPAPKPGPAAGVPHKYTRVGTLGETSPETLGALKRMSEAGITRLPLLFMISAFAGTLQATEPHRYDFAKRASEIDPQAREHPEIKFTFTDDKGKPADLEHAVVDTRVPSQGKLVIWLMGHNQGLFERISSYGYHGIQPHYSNGWFAGVTKSQYEDGSGTAIGKIRLEAATGEDFSPLVNIPKPDGMMERSLQFVKWLAKENPEGKWEQFLTPDGSGLQWEKVIMSGISHGSTTAARFAMHQKVDRVVMFSGPRDNTETWQGEASATPSNRFFGFSHVLDGGWVANHYCRSWQLLKMHNHGPVVNIDTSKPPYGNTRRLLTNIDVKNNSGRAHTIVLPGGKDAMGQWVFDEVLRYLFTHPVDQSGLAVPLEADCEMDQRAK